MILFKKIIISIVAFFVFIGIIGFFILPYVLKPVISDKLSVALHRQVTIEKIGINPYMFSITIKGFKVTEAAQSTPFVSFDELYVNFKGLSSLFRRAIILGEIKLVQPYVGITRKQDGSYNFSDLLPREEEKPESENKPFHFSLNNIQIINGSVDFWDGPNKTKHTVRNMNLAVPVISNIEYYIKNYVEPKFSAKINGNVVEFKGKTKPFLVSRETSFDVDIEDLDIPFYLKYVPVRMNFNLASARLDTKLKIDFVMEKNKQPAIKIAGNVLLRNIALNDQQNNKILRLPALNIDIASAEPMLPDIHLARIAVKDIDLIIKRNKDGELNLLNLVTPAQKDKKQKEKKANKSTEPEEKKHFKMRIDDLQLEVANLTFIDAVPPKQATIRIAPLRLKATNLSTEKEAKGDIDLFLTVDKKGKIAVKGRLGIEPLSAGLTVAVKNLAIRSFQSYFNDQVKVNVQQGSVSTNGKIFLAAGNKGLPRIKYAGKLYVSNLAVIDESHANDFLNWKQLYLDSLQVGYNPFFINIRGISLTDFYARIIINDDSTLNINNIFSDEAENKEDKKEAPAQSVSKLEVSKQQDVKQNDTTKKIKIGSVTFQGGTIDFTDRFIKPNYSVRMLNMTGSIKGLSSEEISRADVNFKGNFGSGSPIDITGKINPLIKDLFADIKVDFKDIELSPITPYSSKYLGHPIAKGKLSFSVEYLVDKGKLEAKNKIMFDQLTFGDKVESPDAIKAPVGLAVSLLTDRNGQINLDIPVSGSLDDPKFRVWPIVWQVIVNLIMKALTSPFTLLASLTGGGEELSYIEFDYGSALVTDANQKKIDSLIKALSERPQLKMDIEGYVDLENDQISLKRAEFNKKLKVQKMKETLTKEEIAAPLEQIQIKPEEYEKYLMLAYEAEKFPKPRNFIGLQKKLPKEEMEKLMITNIEVTNSDLRQLASRRAENVKELFLKSGKVKAGQLFIVEPKSLFPEKKENVKSSRVNFKLK